MPTIHVDRDLLYQSIGRVMTDEEFDEVCFEFGIELDEVTSERQLVAKEQGESKAVSLSDETIYRIEIPANRYDLLSTEGLVRALKSYLLGAPCPQYQATAGPVTVQVQPATATIRPFIACAVLRNVTMTPSFYDSLVDLQDKLHTGLGRKRTILSMGTYDLDKFVPLNRDQSFNGMQLMEMLESDLKLKKFLPIIRDSPLYPVLLDSNGTVLSLPPIINGNSSKITLSTRNIFIDVTGTDATKVGIALNILATSFAQYCETPNTIESVQLLFPSNPPATTPDTRPRLEAVSVEYINRSLGLALSPAEICDLLKRMMLESEPISADFVRVTVPPTRSDVIHVCDVMEDVAISYGFNRLPARLPPTSCVGATAPLNKFTDLLRREIALTGFTEVLTFSLCSHAENFAYLKRADPGNEAVVLSNPKTSEFEVVHTSLIPAMLKTIASNKKMPLPIKIFQITDVVLQDPTHSVGARNERRVCAVYCGMSSGFEVVHGLLDRIMLMLNVPRATANTADGYYISSSDLPTFFPGRQAHVHLNGRIIGAFGIVHPEVAASFDAPYVSSLLEINIEPLL